MVDLPNGSSQKELENAFLQVILSDTQEFGVLFYNEDLSITGWNNGAQFITGWAADEVIGQPTGMLFLPEDRQNKLDVHEAQLARVVGAAQDERWHIRKDSARYWSSGVSLPLSGTDGQPNGFVKVFRDATHLRTRTQYLENLVQEADVQMSEKNVFIGTIAHEMRNPLSPLKSAVELIKRSAGDNAGHLHLIGIIDRQINFLDRLVEDLIGLTRVQTGKLSIAYENVVLQEVLFEVLNSSRESATAKGIVIWEVMPPVPIYVDVDFRRFQQVILNLLNNAIKYTAAGGNVWLTATVDQTHFLCYVKDDGQGIGDSLLPKIFEVFTQADTRKASRGEGLGIGLAVVKEIVSLHQGNVEVKSDGEGKGSEFIVRLPLHRPFAFGSEPLVNGPS
ncbi:PAS domain-containing sensor histidine kinase [Massilia sp. 9096]|uniref:PAS domain-containing sensor histidine kinase n=1 Tax=Massilia sp. 9096 TaxID=1500894 RepID=UPI0009E05C66|nr:PAS domain-containing sensor histidine kinase [Massilia sp. 9096]